jgi:hypothetical protein
MFAGTAGNDKRRNGLTTTATKMNCKVSTDRTVWTPIITIRRANRATEKRITRETLNAFDIWKKVDTLPAPQHGKAQLVTVVLQWL